MTRCDLRTYRECGCAEDHCAAAPPTPIAHAIIPSWRDQLAAVGYGAVVSAFVLVAMWAWNEQLRAENLINQEITHVYRN